MSCENYKNEELSLAQLISNIEFVYDNDLMIHPTSGIMSVTNRCNLQCPYCFHTQSNIDMTFETADRAAQYLIVNSVIMQKRPSIGFFGGEPLLQFNNIIKPLVEKYNNIFDWSITTNGTLLTENIIDFCNQYNISVLLSIDGGEIIQNKQRPLKDGNKSFDLIKKNLPYLLVKKPDTVFRSTITKFSLLHLNEIIETVQRYGFKNMTLIPNGFETWDDTDFCLWRDFVDREGIKIMRHILLDEKLDYHFTNLIDAYHTVLDIENIPKLKNPLSCCGLGIKGIGISPTGELFPCQENNGKDSEESIGNIYSGIDIIKHKNYCLKFYEYWKQYVQQINNSNNGTNNFKLFFANHFCSKRLLENLAYSNTYIYYLKPIHQTCSRFLYNFNYSLHP